MDRRAVAFIDGPNLHSALRGIGLLEKDIDWAKFFARVTPPDHYLVRVYWYQVERIAPHDWYPNQVRLHCPPGQSEEEFLSECQQWLDGEHRRLKDIQDDVYRRLSIDFDLIEFRYVGVLRTNPYRQERLGEKGLDVGLAVDMVSKAHLFDTALLVSGDYDFAPAIQEVKNNLRQVRLVVLVRGEASEQSRYYGMARGLRVLADIVEPVYEGDIKDPVNGLLRKA